MIKLKQKIQEYAQKIDAPSVYLPTIETSLNNGHPMIMKVHGFYHYIIKERDVEYERKIFDSIEKLLFEVFKNATFSIATDFELENRVDYEDSRRLIFKHQLGLLEKLNKDWKKQVKEEHIKILKINPFID